MTLTTSPADTRSQLPAPSRRNVVWLTIQCLLRILFTVWFRYRARGTSRLPVEGGALLLINHQSFLDPLLVGLPLVRPVSFLARDNLFRVPVVGTFLRKTDVIPISRDALSASSMRAAIQRMQDGSLVGIFPEGTRSRDDSVGRFRPGFVSLIRRTGLPVYPIGIAGAHAALPRGARWIRPSRIRVIFGEPLRPDEIDSLSARGRDDELVEWARACVIKCQHEAESWRKHGLSEETGVRDERRFQNGAGESS